ncbi:ion channel [Tenuibacillus multivorans]|uniref:Potassium channel LctB n=1 Tax=Tenuibacillus multivorans TaxID=237069 RepID=A0A1H0FXY2_9BACI|nr:ion channel [Tenuibacillus multivorans]GEL78166.1 LCTB protein [Tenuibacillus multivorans]SDN99424.1 potassium channel LctB [Tenuibacillus multivorans]
MKLFSVAFVAIIVISSIYTFLKHNTRMRNAFSKELFISFLIIYAILMVGFALIYFLMSRIGFTVLSDMSLQYGASLDRFLRSFYFSGVTLMTVGYGDIYPVGVARFVSLVEAAIGYLLPAAFLYKLIK